MNVKHIGWIDAIKGFGIILVTFAHLSPWYPLEKHIFSFHMCLFFFISGYLFKQGDTLNSFIGKKAKSILVPFIVWDLFSSFVALALGEGLERTIARFFVIDGDLCWNSPIWFLLILFISETIYAMIMKVNDSKKTSILILCVSCLLWILFGERAFTLKLNLVPLAVFFYALGHLFRRQFDEKEYSNSIIIIAAMLFGLMNIIFGVILNVRIAYTRGIFGNMYYCIIASISGTLFYWLIFKNWKVLESNKLLCVLGKNSLIIMATQYCFFGVYDIFSQKLFGMSVWHERSTMKAIVVTIVTITFIMILVSIIKSVFKNNRKVLNLAKYIGIR